MIIIAHRGNLFGPDSILENNPIHLKNVLRDTSFDIEIDVWKIGDVIYLGHDFPCYEVASDFIKNNRFWCHAKNLAALEWLLENDVHCFSHDKDNYVITSKGFIWSYEGMQQTKKTIDVMPERVKSIADYNEPSLGVCTDYPFEIKKMK